MSKNLNEITKIVSKTRPNGEVDFEPMDQDVATRLNNTTVDDGKGNRIKIKDTGKTINEAETIDTGDFVNLGKALNSAVEKALRQHGDDVAYTKPRANLGKNYVSIYVYYKNNPDNPGQPSEDKFTFRVEGDSIKLQNGSELIDVCPVNKNTGTLYINSDLAKDAIMNFIEDHDEPTEGKSTEDDVPNGQGFENDNMEAQDSYKTDDLTLSEDLLLGFKKAVDNYRANKSKDTIKELFKASRGFEGDDIKEKFKNAVKAYLNNADQPESQEMVAIEEPVQDEPQVVSPQDDRVEIEPEQGTCCNDEGNVCMDMSLFIRLMEFAKEEAADDPAIHFVAENVQNLCAEKGCVSMDDYEEIISKSETKKAEEMDESLSDVDPDLDGFLSWCRDAGISPNSPGARAEYEAEMEEMNESYDEDGDWVDPMDPNYDFDAKRN